MIQPCPHCEGLRAEVAHLRAELAIEVEDYRVATLCSRLGLTKHEALLMLILHARRGRPVRVVTIEADLPEIRGQERAPSNTVAVLVNRLRGKLGEDAIGTDRGVGYRLTARGSAIIDAVRA